MLTEKELLEVCKMGKLPFPMRKRQIEAISSFIEDNDVAFFAPTGIGKTLPATMAAKYVWETQGLKTIFIGLFKSLTEEQYDTLSKLLPTLIDNSDHRKKKMDYIEMDWVIACMTPEKFDGIMNNPGKRDVVMDEVGLIIVDEVHSLGDAGRGHVIENFIITTKENYEDLRYMFLSATVGNPEEFNEWLESDLILAKQDERPVDLDLNIIPYKELTYGYDGPPNFKANLTLRTNMLRSLINRKKSKNWLIFVSSRPRTESIAFAMTRNRKRCSLEDLIEIHGIGYHNAGLSPSEKKYVEESFRSGTINILVSTSTLAAGVNLPADCTVIFDVEQYDGSRGTTTLGANRIQQSVGRAGRPGLSDMGYAFIFTPRRLLEQITQYATIPANVKSQIKPRLHQKILQWIAGENAYDVESVMSMAARSYANITKKEALKAINWLVWFEFLWKEPATEMLQITWVGTKTVQMQVLPETVILWQGQACSIIDPTDFNEIYIRFGSVPEYYNIVTVREEDGFKLMYARKELGSYMPRVISCPDKLCFSCSMINVCTIKEMRDECKVYTPRHIEWDETPAELHKAFFLTFADELIDKYKITKKVILTKGDRANMIRGGTRMFGAASVIFGNNKPLSEMLNTIANMCGAGTFKAELVDLCRLKQIGLKRAKLLFAKGITTVGQFLDKNPRYLGPFMKVAPRVAKNIQEINMELRE